MNKSIKNCDNYSDFRAGPYHLLGGQPKMEKRNWEEIVQDELLDEQEIKQCTRGDLSKMVMKLLVDRSDATKDHERAIGQLRLEKEELESQLNQQPTEGENDSEKKIRELLKEKADLLQTLGETREILLDREKSANELLRRLASESKNDTIDSNQTLLCITSSSMHALKDKLSANYVWNFTTIESVNDLGTSSILSLVKEALLTVIIVGNDDIIKGRNSNTTFTRLTTSVKNFSRDGHHVVLVQVPPSGTGSVSVDVDLLNFKIADLDEDNFQIITHSSEIQNQSKSKLLEPDMVTLSSFGASLYGSMISEKMIIKPKVLKPISSNICSHGDQKITEFFDVDPKAFGAIIGKGGEQIQELTTENDVKIAIGGWVDKKNKSSTKERAGALITGSFDNICKTKRKIDEIVNTLDKKMRNK